MKPETKLGIFTVIGLFVLGFSLYFLGGFSITRTYDVNIKFQDVSGLPVKAAVKNVMAISVRIFIGRLLYFLKNKSILYQNGL